MSIVPDEKRLHGYTKNISIEMVLYIQYVYIDNKVQ